MKGNIGLFSSKAKQLTNRGPEVQSTSPLPSRCPGGNTGAKRIQMNVDDERHYDIKNSREHKGKKVGSQVTFHLFPVRVIQLSHAVAILAQAMLAQPLN